MTVVRKLRNPERAFPGFRNPLRVYCASNQRLPKVLKVPEGEIYVATENPLGFNGYFLVSRGEKTPWRLKLRSASFNNVQVLSHMLPGQLVSDMVAILGSMFFVVGDVDK